MRLVTPWALLRAGFHYYRATYYAYALDHMPVDSPDRFWVSQEYMRSMQHVDTVFGNIWG